MAVTGRNFELLRSGRQIIVAGIACGLTVHWELLYGNSLEQSELAVKVWHGRPLIPGELRFDKPQSVGSRKFEFDITPADAHVWRALSPAREYDTQHLARFLLDWLLEEEQKKSG